MNDLAVLNGRPRRFEAGGEAHDIYPLSLADLGDLQAWVDAQLPDPWTIARKQLDSGEWTIEQQKLIMRCAMEESCKPRPKLGTPEADALVATFDGKVETLYLAIRKGEPHFTRAQAKAFLQKLSEAETNQAVSITDVELVSDPKGTPTPGMTTPREFASTIGGPSTIRP